MSGILLGMVGLSYRMKKTLGMKYLILILILFLSQVASAVDNDGGFWTGTVINKKLNSRFSFWTDAQFRYSFDLGSNYENVFRPGLYYHFSNTTRIGLLYGVFSTSPNREHRPTLDVIHHKSLSNDTTLTLRGRFEQRLFEDQNNDSTRARFMIRLDHNLDDNWAPVISDEAFVYISDEWKTFDQNWLFVGVGRNFENIKLEFGYMNQLIRGNKTDQMNHLMIMYFIL
jgi:hypothetical protein